MSVGEPVPIIQVGLGPWGLDWARTVLASSDAVTVVARVDSDPERAASLGREVATYTSLGEALANTSAQAVLITARIEAHHGLAREALSAGRHVLLEKPFTVTVAQAQDLNELAANRERVLCVAQNYRFWPVIQAARELLAQQVLGDLENVQIRFRRDHPNYGPSVTAPAGAPTGSILYQISVHHIDLIRALLGEVREVTARRWQRTALPGRLTALSALFRLESGLLVDYNADQASRAVETPWSGEWTIEGTAGQLRFAGGPTTDDAVLELTRDQTTSSLPIPEPTLGDREQVLADFVAAIRGGVESPLAGSNNIRTLQAVLDTVESIQADQA